MVRLTPTVFCLASLLVSPLPGAPSGDSDLLAVRLSQRVTLLEREIDTSIASEPIHALAPLGRLYQARGHEPLWLAGDRPSESAYQAAQELGRAVDHGLEPDDYHHRAIIDLLATTRQGWTKEELIDLELLLSDGLLRYGAHLLSGRLRAGLFDQALGDFRHELDLIPLVEQAAAGEPAEVWQQVVPIDPGYRHLQAALRRYRDAAGRGGWPKIPPGPVLGLGSRAPETRLAPLRARLQATEDLPASLSETPGVYGQVLTDALQRFQKRHGLTADGKLGPATSRELAVSAAERARRIELSLERFRWLPRDLGERHVRVNIPSFQLAMVERERTVLEMAVIVGRPDRPTPTFSDQVRYLVFRPYWEVPFTLATEDELPAIQKDVAHVSRRNFEVLKGWGEHERFVDPHAVDWGSLARDDFPYRLRQRPGRGNALGRVKFMFPNPFDVYLHDTPKRQLFDRAQRDLSSGCIRIERPIELAAELLEGTPLWDRWRVDRLVASGQQSTVNLLSPVPIHLLYFTAWPDEHGSVGFFEDIYDLDAALRSDLDRLWARGSFFDENSSVKTIR